MNTRSSRSVTTFINPFILSGDSDELPAGEYEVLIEEELIEGLSFPAYRRTATYLMVHGKGLRVGTTSMRQTTKKDLEAAHCRDRALSEGTASI